MEKDFYFAYSYALSKKYYLKYDIDLFTLCNLKMQFKIPLETHFFNVLQLLQNH